MANTLAKNRLSVEITPARVENAELKLADTHADKQRSLEIAPVRVENAELKLADTPVRVVTDFSGIETPTMALRQLGVRHVLVSTSENCPAARDFVVRHFAPAEMRCDAAVLADSGGEGTTLYVAGFPCQPHSLLGKRQGLQDEKGRGQGGDLCVSQIRALQPRSFVLENVVGLLSIDKGKTFQSLLEALRGCGYSVSWSVIDAAAVGSAQGRRRIYIVGRRGLWDQAFAFPDPRPQGRLEDFLDAREAGDTPFNLPPSRGARANVLTERRRCKPAGVDLLAEERVINIDCSVKRLGKSKPMCPCLLAGHGSGFWLMSRGRRMRPLEALRLQGVQATAFTWPESRVEMFRMAGNAMNVDVLVAVFSRLLADLGIVGASHVWPTTPPSLSAAVDSVVGGPVETVRRPRLAAWRATLPQVAKGRAGARWKRNQWCKRSPVMVRNMRAACRAAALASQPVSRCKRTARCCGYASGCRGGVAQCPPTGDIKLRAALVRAYGKVKALCRFCVGAWRRRRQL